MPETAFVIYQTSDGYTAVTSETRAKILEALDEEGELELGDLVEITGRSKPTLSSVHMRELLDRELIEARVHPDDRRRKLYALRAKRIGSSDLPLEELRSAVKEYVSTSPMAARLPLAITFKALAGAPPGTDPSVIEAQGRALGRLTSHLFEGAPTGSLLMDLSTFLDREGLASTLRIDMEGRIIELALSEELATDGQGDRSAAALAGFLSGVAEAIGEDGAPRITTEALDGPHRFAYHLATPEA